MNNIKNKKELELYVMNSIGLYDNNGILTDQEYNNSILFDGKIIRVPNEYNILHKNDIIFNILENKKLCEFLLKVLFMKEELENDVYVQSYYEINDKNNPCLSALEVIADKEKIRTTFYKNECLKYLDMIINFNSFNKINLLNFDN